MLEGFIFFQSILAPVSWISDFADTWIFSRTKDFLALETIVGTNRFWDETDQDSFLMSQHVTTQSFWCSAGFFSVHCKMNWGAWAFYLQLCEKCARIRRRSGGVQDTKAKQKNEATNEGVLEEFWGSVVHAPGAREDGNVSETSWIWICGGSDLKLPAASCACCACARCGSGPESNNIKHIKWILRMWAGPWKERRATESDSWGEDSERKPNQSESKSKLSVWKHAQL